MREGFRYDIEVLRILSMLSIVVGHCFSFGSGSYIQQLELVSTTSLLYKATNPFLIYFALPAFTTISGYLIGYRGNFESPDFSYGQFLLKKFRRLYLPGLVFSLLYSALFSPTDYFQASSIISLFVEGSGHLWFLFMLFALYVIAYPLYFFARRHAVAAITISFAVSLGSCFFSLETSILTLFFYQFFFLSGIFIGRKHTKKRYRPADFGVVRSVIVRFVIYSIIFCVLSLVKSSPYVVNAIGDSIHLHYFQHWGFRLVLGTVAVACAFSLLPIMVHGKQLLRYVSSLCYKIYIFHQFILFGLLSLLPDSGMGLSTLQMYAFPFVLSIVVLLLSFSLAALSCHVPLLKNI